MFNPMKNRILGPNPTPGPNGASGWFIKYSLTKLELRRLLAEARLKNESFAIEYIELERGREPGRRVALVEDGSGRRRCRAWGGAGCGGGAFFGLGGGCACEPSDVAMLAPPGYWAWKLLVQQPYPILEDPSGELGGELVCFGP